VNKKYYFYIFVWIIRYYANVASSFPFLKEHHSFSHHYIQRLKNKLVLFDLRSINCNIVTNFKQLNSGYRQLIVTFFKLMIMDYKSHKFENIVFMLLVARGGGGATGL